MDERYTPPLAPAPAAASSPELPRPSAGRDSDPTRGLVPPTRRTPETAEGQGADGRAQGRRGQHLSGPARAGGDPRVYPQTRSTPGRPKPGDVRRGDRGIAHDDHAGESIRHQPGQPGLYPADQSVAVVHGAVRQFRRGDGRGAGQGPGRYAARTQQETPADGCATATKSRASSTDLRKGDIVIVREDEIIPGDGEVIEGVAYVNEAAITGESAPVLKEPGTDIRSA